MGKIKKILETELVGGTQQTDIYPVTSIKAVYDEDNERLDNILNRRSVVNISINYNADHMAETLTLAQAIAKVPTKDKVLGFQGKYLSTDGWRQVFYTGDSIESWAELSNWVEVKEELFTSLAENALFAGVATPATIPSMPNGPIFYIVSDSGTYDNFSVTINPNETAILLWNGTKWRKLLLNIPPMQSFLKLSLELGEYNGTIESSKTIFDNSEVEAGSVIRVSFTTTGPAGNILVIGTDSSVLKRFEILNGKSGDTYPEETYTLPANYKELRVGGFGTINVSIYIDDRIISNVKKKFNEQLNSLDNHIQVLEQQVQDNLYIESQEKVEMLPTSIDEGKFLYTNGNESSSSIQNIANYDVSKITGNKLVILANVSTNPSVGYCIIMQDGTTVYDSEYATGGSVTEHEIAIPQNAESLRFSYIKAGNISAYYRQTQAIGDIVLGMEEELSNVENRVSNIEKNLTDVKSVDVALSLAGTDSISLSKDTLEGGSILTLNDAPQYTKKDCIVSFEAKIVSFDSVMLGWGNETARGLTVTLTDSKITYVVSGAKKIDEEHNLTIDKFLKCSIYHNLNKYIIVISSISGVYTKTIEETQLYYAETYGLPFIQANVLTQLSDVKISRAGSDFKKPVWIFGDSYTSFSEKRWPYYIINWGFSKFMLCGLAGATSQVMFSQLELCLKLGTPKYLVWCLGMNDGTEAAPYETYLNKVKSICDEKGIELIVQTIPNVPSANKDKINAVIASSKVRYIDVSSAVGADNDGNWYDGYNDDGVHPTELGAKAIASQILIDFPEIMQYEI